MNPAALGLIEGRGIQQLQQLHYFYDAASRELAIEHDIFLAPRYVFGDGQIVRVQRQSDDPPMSPGGRFTNLPFQPLGSVAVFSSTRVRVITICLMK